MTHAIHRALRSFVTLMILATLWGPMLDGAFAQEATPSADAAVENSVVSETTPEPETAGDVNVEPPVTVEVVIEPTVAEAIAPETPADPVITEEPEVVDEQPATEVPLVTQEVTTPEATDEPAAPTSQPTEAVVTPVVEPTEVAGGVEEAAFGGIVIPVPPVAVNDTVSVHYGTAPLEIDLLGNDFDLNGDALILDNISNKPTADIARVQSCEDGTCTILTSTFFVGQFTFNYQLRDAVTGTLSNTALVTVSFTDSPAVAVDDALTITKGELAIVPLFANDIDADDTSFRQGPFDFTGFEGISISCSTPEEGKKCFSITAGFVGVTTFTYKLINPDPNGSGEAVLTAPATVTITVLDAPTQLVDDDFTTAENTGIFFDPVANDISPDGDELTLADCGIPSFGTIELRPNGAILECFYAPNFGFVGVDTFTYGVNDTIGDLIGSVNMTVTDRVSDPPVANPDDVRVIQDRLQIFNPGTNDSDPEGNPAFISSFSQPAHGTLACRDLLPGTSFCSADMVYQPDPGFTGSDSFTYQITDDTGAQSNVTTVSILVTPVRLPVALPDEVTIPPDVISALDVLANDSDADGVPIYIVNIVEDTNVETACTLHDPIQTSQCIQVSVQPVAGFTGDTFIEYLVTNDDGEFSNSVTVTIHVVDGAAPPTVTPGAAGTPGSGTPTTTPGNREPQANDDIATTTNSSIELDVVGNDTDPDGDSLTIASVGTSPNATISCLSTCTITRNAGFLGTVNIPYSVTDGSLESNGASIIVTFEDSNVTPESTATATTAPKPTSTPTTEPTATFTATTEPTATQTVTTEPPTSTATATTRPAEPTATPTTEPTATRTATATEIPASPTPTEEVATDPTIDPSPDVNEPPDVVDDAFKTLIDVALVVPAPGVLSNDSDPEGDPFTPELTEDAQHGALTLQADGSFSYVPDPGFAGADQFVYRAGISGNQTTGFAEFDVAVVTIQVEEPDPTEAPSEEPTEDPTSEPTSEPTTEPSAKPTDEPTVEPTNEPTAVGGEDDDGAGEDEGGEDLDSPEDDPSDQNDATTLPVTGSGEPTRGGIAWLAPLAGAIALGALGLTVNPRRRRRFR